MLCPVKDEPTLSSVRGRGLSGVHLVIFDAHRGLKAATAQQFAGSAWHRCRMHFMRSIRATVGAKHVPPVMAAAPRGDGLRAVGAVRAASNLGDAAIFGVALPDPATRTKISGFAASGGCCARTAAATPGNSAAHLPSSTCRW